MNGRNLGEDAEPAEGIDLFIKLQGAQTGTVARLTPWKAVASGDEVAIDAMRRPVLFKGYEGLAIAKIMRLDVDGVVDRASAGRLPRIHEIPGHLGLAVDRDALSAEIGKIDPMILPVEGKGKAVMRQAFLMKTSARARFVDQADRALLEHAGPDAAKNVIAPNAIEDDRLDTMTEQELAEQQAGGPGADDDDLGTNERESPVGRAVETALTGGCAATGFSSQVRSGERGDIGTPAAERRDVLR